MNSVNVNFYPHLGASTTDAEHLSKDGTLEDRVIAAIRTVFDPELPVNVYDLGLIYDLTINDQGEVDIKMTLTSPACPVAGSLPCKVENAVRTVEGISAVHLELVWDPPWTRERMNETAQLALGIL